MIECGPVMAMLLHSKARKERERGREEEQDTLVFKVIAGKDAKLTAFVYFFCSGMYDG